MKYYVEGYGCAFNLAETEQIKGLFEKNNFTSTAKPSEASILLVNTCAVKDTTEKRMLHRLKTLFKEKTPNGKLIAFGCLAATRQETIQKISDEIIVLDTDLESLCKVLEVEVEKFSPKMKKVESKELISIIPISVGCLGSCTYCATKIARGDLHSYSIDVINKSFQDALTHSKEIWITSQDLGCYGFDQNTNLRNLLETLLKNEGKYFVRLGMMNPNHFLMQHNEIMKIFDDSRVFKFLHIPLQFGSNRILKEMNRQYNAEQFVKCVELARKEVPEITVATDVIVGFPGETEKEFEETLDVLGKIKPDVINIARYSKRPETNAAQMQNQLQEGEKKERSKKLTEFRAKLFNEKNEKMVGKTFEALVSEKKYEGSFIARISTYRPVVVPEKYGKFVKVKITKASTNFFFGKIIK